MYKKFIFSLIIIAASIAIITFIPRIYAEDKPKVVVVLRDIDTQYWQIIKVGAQKGFQDFGMDGKILASTSLSKKGNQQEKLLEKVLKEESPDILIVAPDDTPEVKSSLQKFVDRKIPVLFLDTDVRFNNNISFIGTNNFDLGRKAGALLASQLQPGDEVAILGDELTGPVSGERIKGAKYSLEAAGIEIAAVKLRLANDPARVRKAMTDILKKHSDIKGVFAITDIVALSALEIIEKHEQSIPVIGADGIMEMTKLINNETLSATVAQNPYDIGYIGVQTAMKVVEGDKVEEEIDTGVDIIIKDNAKQKLDFLQGLLK